MPEAHLRVVDAGVVGAARSQSLWHGIASAMDAGAAPVLSLCRPRRPYVGLGYHRSLQELDLSRCEDLGLPVIRRRIGGGPVYVDSDQLFFQISLGAARAPARVDRLYRRLLAPAVEVFRGLGVPARLSAVNEIGVAGRRLSGTGAGRIGDGVTVVGNVLFSFPHRRMSEILRLPSDGMRRECLRLMRRHVSSLAGEGVEGTDGSEVAAALVRAYGRGLDLEPRPGPLTPAEQTEIERWEARFADPAWRADRSPPRQAGRRVKICAGVWVFAGAAPGLRAEISVAGGRIERARFRGAALNGQASEMSRALLRAAAEPRALARRLEPFGDIGRRAAALLAPGLAPE